MRGASTRIDPGVQVGPYLLEHRLGGRGASALYAARDDRGGRVALRLFDAAAVSKAARTRMRREARALAEVDHPGVVALLGTGDHDGMPWIAWTQLRGGDLARLLTERGALPFSVALEYAIDVTEALVAAHAAGVAHRELRPSNVVLTPEGRPVLVDFGLVPRMPEARDPDEPTGVRDAAADVRGYEAPEQVEHGLADERSDVWAMGCLLYEMLTGEPPFGRGGAATAAAIPRDEPTFPAAVPATTVHVISACLRKNSFARIATGHELLALLRDALDEPFDEAPTADRASMSPSLRPVYPPSGTIPPPPRLPSSTSLAISASRTAASRRPPSSATRARSPRGRVKGTAVRPALAWFAERHGAAGLARLVELASPELRGILRAKDPTLGLIASGWYDTQRMGELIDLIECVASPGDRAAFGSAVGDAVGQDNVAGVHKALFRLVSSPPMLEANAQRVWRTYVDEGTLSVQVTAARAFRARVRGWSHHHTSVCRTLRAMLESSLRAVGYRALVLERTQCVGLGDTQCTFDGRWSA